MASNGALGAIRTESVNDYTPMLRELGNAYGITLDLPTDREYSERGPNSVLHPVVSLVKVVHFMTYIIQNQQREIENLRESIENTARELKLFDYAEPAVKRSKT